MTEPSHEPSPEDALQEAFGRGLGFAAAAVLLLLGGGLGVFLVAAAFFRFLFGG